MRTRRQPGPRDRPAVGGRAHRARRRPLPPPGWTASRRRAGAPRRAQALHHDRRERLPPARRRVRRGAGIMVEDSPDPFKTLTQREQDIALLVCQGMSNKQIAERLYLSPKTVETHLTRVFAKLDVSARGDLKGLIDAGD